MHKVRKAIMPVAGAGTRFLPATKAQPKEMLPVVDKPIIQYLVEEASAAGIKDIIFVTGAGKRAIEDHFDYNFELAYLLKSKEKTKELNAVKKITDLASFAYCRQPRPLGDGHAVLQAKDWVGNEAVAMFYGDDIIVQKVPCIKRLIDVYYKYNDVVIALERVPRKEVNKYGVVDAVEIEKGVFQIKKFVEKPSVAKAPSNLTFVGRAVLTPEIFKVLTRLKPGKDGEIRLANAFQEILKNKPIYGYEFEGVRHDCGSKIGFLKANVDFGLKHKDLKQEFKKYLKSLNF